MRSLSQRTCWNERRSRERYAGLRDTWPCADRYGRPTTVGPRDNLVLRGARKRVPHLAAYPAKPEVTNLASCSTTGSELDE